MCAKSIERIFVQPIARKVDNKVNRDNRLCCSKNRNMNGPLRSWTSGHDALDIFDGTIEKLLLPCPPELQMEPKEDRRCSVRGKLRNLIAVLKRADVTTKRDEWTLPGVPKSFCPRAKITILTKNVMCNAKRLSRIGPETGTDAGSKQEGTCTFENRAHRTFGYAVALGTIRRARGMQPA
jgi:hypothetical protein